MVASVSRWAGDVPDLRPLRSLGLPVQLPDMPAQHGGESAPQRVEAQRCGAPTDEILALRDIDIVHESDEREVLRLYRKSRPGARRLLLQMLAQHVALES